MSDRIRTLNIVRHTPHESPSSRPVSDDVIVEEPLEIRLGFTRRGKHRQKPVSITMRTPGDDFELALGFLYGEKILSSPSQVREVVHCGDGANENVVRVELARDVEVDLTRLQRNFYTTSSCGVCGKSSLEALEVTGYDPIESSCTVSSEVLGALPDALRQDQSLFSRTGGLHAVGLFEMDGSLAALREDVGRHNAMDKLVGWAFQNARLPLDQHIAVLSGRASFELVQKAVAASIPIVAAVGAPSSLAIELADRFGITLAGFVREQRLNIYTHPERVSDSN